MPSKRPSYTVRKQQELNYAAHRHRIETMKCNIDCTLPLGMRPEATSKLGKKKEMDRNRYYRKLEKENRILLERLSKVMQQKNIDNECKGYDRAASKFRELLTAQARKSDLQRITEENQRLLKRIQTVESAYDHTEWEEEARRHDMHLKFMCEYPLVIGLTTGAASPEDSPKKEPPSLGDKIIASLLRKSGSAPSMAGTGAKAAAAMRGHSNSPDGLDASDLRYGGGGTSISSIGHSASAAALLGGPMSGRRGGPALGESPSMAALRGGGGGGGGKKSFLPPLSP